VGVAPHGVPGVSWAVAAGTPPAAEAASLPGSAAFRAGSPNRCASGLDRACASASVSCVLT
jgi:hypothetical protein